MINLNEVAKVLIVPITTAFLTTAGILATGAFGYWNKDRSQDIEMVNIALSILAGDNDQEKSLPGRRFALRLLQKNSGIEIPSGEFVFWAKEGTLPDEFRSIAPELDVGEEKINGVGHTCSNIRRLAILNPEMLGEGVTPEAAERLCDENTE